MDFSECISAHVQWKARLTLLLQGASQEGLDPEVIAKDDRCPLGVWIHGEGRQLYGDLGAYLGLRDKHALFHRCTAEVVRSCQQGDPAGAQRRLDGDFARLSSETVGAITRLRQAAGL
jgi:hypothetical protein